LLGLLAGVGAVLLASCTAYALAQLWGGGGAGAAAVAAALGVAVAAVPLALMLSRLAPASLPAAARPLSGPPTSAGVPRALFMDLAQREWARARRYGNGAALLLVDVDRYARLCESRGAAVGDTVLAELLRQTAPTLRPADVLTRFGESQMAVFLTPADATGALDVAERIRERAEQFEVPLAGSSLGHPQRLRFTVSVGVAHLRPAHLNLQAVIEDAEDALAAARAAAGNCVRAAPVESGRGRGPGSWRGDERRTRPKQGGAAPL
jgi:diguanylate cyclase (GGDEF)-like protein